MTEPVEQESLRRSIRTRLAFGILSPVAGAAWVGEARGNHRCAICERLITAREMEYQPHGLEPPAHAHVQCYTAWLVESRFAAATRRRPSETAERYEPPTPLEEAG